MTSIINIFKHFSVAFLALSCLMSTEVLGKRGDSNGRDEANAYDVVLIEDDYIKLTVYYYNDDKYITMENGDKKRIDRLRGDTELVIKKAQDGNVLYGFCIDMSPIYRPSGSSSSTSSGGFQTVESDNSQSSSAAEDDDPFKMGQFDNQDQVEEVREDERTSVNEPIVYAKRNWDCQQIRTNLNSTGPNLPYYTADYYEIDKDFSETIEWFEFEEFYNAYFVRNILGKTSQNEIFDNLILIELLKGLTLEEIFDNLDLNKNGTFDIHEWHEFLRINGFKRDYFNQFILYDGHWTSDGAHDDFTREDMLLDYGANVSNSSHNWYHWWTKSYKKCEKEAVYKRRDDGNCYIDDVPRWCGASGRYVDVIQVTCPQYEYKYPYRYGVNTHWFRDFQTKQTHNVQQHDVQLDIYKTHPDTTYNIFGFYQNFVDEKWMTQSNKITWKNGALKEITPVSHAYKDWVLDVSDPILEKINNGEYPDEVYAQFSNDPTRTDKTLEDHVADALSAFNDERGVSNSKINLIDHAMQMTTSSILFLAASSIFAF